MLARGLWKTADPQPRLPAGRVGHDPPLLPQILLQALGSLRRTARSLPLLPAPGHGQAPALGSRRSRQRPRQRAVGLHVTADNLRALRLYESEGYKEVSRQRSLITAYFLDIREWLYLKKEL